MNIFYVLLFQPILNLLVFFYNIIPGAEIGFAIIALTILIKLILWPLMNTSLKSQKALQELQPKMNELKEKYKDDKTALSKAMMELYKNEKVNPLSSCLPVLIQLPVLIALYQVLYQGFGTNVLGQLYPFIHNPEHINTVFLGLVDLSKINLPLAVLSGVLQFFQTRMIMARQPKKPIKGIEGAKDENMMMAMNRSMMYLMPLMTVFIGAKLPGGLTLYWVVVNIISIVQQYIVFNKMKKVKKEQGT